jgi:hypothetical protein
MTTRRQLMQGAAATMLGQASKEAARIFSLIFNLTALQNHK